MESALFWILRHTDYTFTGGETGWHLKAAVGTCPGGDVSFRNVRNPFGRCRKNKHCCAFVFRDSYVSGCQMVPKRVRRTLCILGSIVFDDKSFFAVETVDVFKKVFTVSLAAIAFWARISFSIILNSKSGFHD